MNKKPTHLSPEIRALFENYYFIFSMVVFSIYIYSMVVYPFFNGGFSQLMATWKYWESFNAAMIALFSALVVYFATKIDEMRMREIERIRHKAILSLHLSLLCDFTQAAFAYIVECKKRIVPIDYQVPNYVIEAEPIALPKIDYGTIEFLSESTKYLDRDVALRISMTILDLQVFQSRIKSLDDRINGRDRITFYTKNSFLNFMLDAMIISKNALSLFSYARGELSSFEDISFHNVSSRMSGEYIFSQEELKYLEDKFNLSPYIINS